MSYETDFDKVRPWPEQQQDMHVCPDPKCRAEMVQPVWWEHANPTVIRSDGPWIVQLYCGECQSFFQGTFDGKAVAEFDYVLDGNMEQIKEELERIEHNNMEQLIDRFTAALQTGHILPEDF